ncbi:MAG TPA: 3'(2'),5'-bisphosphate nucleotidase CysQ [Nitrosopumilaceae archaeon]|nr:3'(2'),5'-bisphosphate nucleotidase CysQ [Nitrosopumilaceae archaeon]
MSNNIPIQNLLPEAKLAIEAAILAGKEVMSVYEKDFSSTLKNDDEPLTEADVKSNDIILKTISNSGHPILSEESVDDKKRLHFKKIWIVDPLDGTSDFIKKTGEFTIMISLVEEHIPILGVIYWPTESTLYLAQKDQGAFKSINDTWSKISVSNVSDLEKCRAVGSRYHISEVEQNLIKRLNVSQFTSKGSSLKAAEISSGNAELYFTTTNKIKQWDTCASYCLITEAGGKMTDMHGNDLKYNTEKLNHENGLLVSNGLIHNQVTNIYDEFLKNNQ